jgi:hypothetical protein
MQKGPAGIKPWAISVYPCEYEDDAIGQTSRSNNGVENTKLEGIFDL